jgi:hypothetical protein
MKIAAISAIGIILTSAVPAFAGSSVSNVYDNKVITGGTSTTNISVDEYKNYTQVNTSDAIKVETYGGTVNNSTATYNGTTLTGTGTSSNTTVVDPTAIITVASQKETVLGTVDISVDTLEKYNFSGNTYTHTVTSDNN